MHIRSLLVVVLSLLTVAVSAQEPSPPADSTAVTADGATADQPVVEVFQQPTTTPMPAAQGQVPPAPQQAVVQPPAYVQQPSYGRLQRARYEEGMTIPTGGRLVQRRRLGLIIAGAATFAVPYLSILAVAFDVGFDQLPWELYVPAVGPFLLMGRELSSGVKTGLFFLGAVQVAGVAMFAAGMVERDYVEWYAGTEPGVRLAPSVSPDGAALTLQGRF